MLKHVVLPAALLCAAALTASSQTTPASQHDEVMKQHEQMMAEMKAADAKLDELVAAMNEAKGDAKVAAMAKVITELARQHRTMQGRMGMMDQQMMMGMMGGRGMRQGK